MTSRQVYEGVLIELNKVNAPSLLLEDFNYLFNKAIYQYINKRYNIYDINQQTTDDIRVLKSTCILPVSLANDYNVSGNIASSTSLYGATFEANLPTDYLHILNCICNFKVNKNFKCYNAGTYVQFNATRLTADLWGQIINNFYMRPSYKKPYYYIHNVNSSLVVPTNPYVASGRVTTTTANNYPTGTTTVINNVETPLYYQTTTVNTGDPVMINGVHIKEGANPLYYDHSQNGVGGLGSGTDTEHIKTISNDNSVSFTGGLSRSLLQSNDLVEKKAAVRYGNATSTRIEIRYGKDASLFELENVYIDYIKTPQHIRLTQEELDLTEDTSQMMEFPDYVCQEIINELVKLVLENSGDPRLQSNIAVNQSIANPAQQQTQQ